MKLFQNLIYQVKNIIDVEFGITDETGLIVACSQEERIGSEHPLASKAIHSKDQVVVIDETAFQKVYIKNRLEFIVFIKYENNESLKYLSFISINAGNIKQYYEEKFDKSSFIKSIILDNVSSGEILLKSRELHIPYSTRRVVFLIKTEKIGDMHTPEIVQSLFPNKLKDFVIMLDDENSVLIKEFKPDAGLNEIEKPAHIIIDTLSTESMINARIGIGSVVDSIADIGRSYREAVAALQVGGIFDGDRNIANYNRLGIGRLIYSLTEDTCWLFLKEVFNEGTFEALDAETLFTIQKFFDNSLNISETSKQLYVHRNTLVYRLDKIQKITGLDLRNFNDAITFKVSMLVKRYLDKRRK